MMRAGTGAAGDGRPFSLATNGRQLAHVHIANVTLAKPPLTLYYEIPS